MHNIADRPAVPCCKYHDVAIGLGHGRGRRITEHDVKYVENREDQAPAGYPFAYSLRGSDYDFGKPVTVEEKGCCQFLRTDFFKRGNPEARGRLLTHKVLLLRVRDTS